VAYGVGWVISFPLIQWGAQIYFKDGKDEAGATPAMQALSHAIGQSRWPPILAALGVFLFSGGFAAETPAGKRFFGMAVFGSMLAAFLAFGAGYWNWRIG
jgi:hypothetical protein